MIGALEGTVLSKTSEKLLLMVGGVGYQVLMHPDTLSSLHQGDKLTLFIHTHVREDALQLFGFKTLEELELFTLLLGVSGVGPKTALLVMGRGVKPVKHAIQHADVTFFTSIPRLGTKNAQKVIIELKSKLGSLKELDLHDDSSDETQEITEALGSMGFSKAEALKALRKMPDKLTSLEEKIKFSIKLLGTRNA